MVKAGFRRPWARMHRQARPACRSRASGHRDRAPGTLSLPHSCSLAIEAAPPKQESTRWPKTRPTSPDCSPACSGGSRNPPPRSRSPPRPGASGRDAGGFAAPFANAADDLVSAPPSATSAVPGRSAGREAALGARRRRSAAGRTGAEPPRRDCRPGRPRSRRRAASQRAGGSACRRACGAHPRPFPKASPASSPSASSTRPPSRSSRTRSCGPISGLRPPCGSPRPCRRDATTKEISADEVKAILAAEVEQALLPVAKPLALDRAKKPFVILMVGVNGSGKTTTIGKLAQKFRAQGMKVMIAAGDTFRAAAIEQLKVWGERVGAPVVARAPGSDAAGLAFDAFAEAREKGIDVLLIDTAGRLQNKAGPHGRARKDRAGPAQGRRQRPARDAARPRRHGRAERGVARSSCSRRPQTSPGSS